MSKILVIAEHLDGKLNPSTARCVTLRARPQARSDRRAGAGRSSPTPSPPTQRRSTASASVLTIARAENAHPLAAVLAPQIAKVAAGYTHVFAPSTTFGKDVAPRVAALLGVAQVSDVMSVEGSHTFKRPIYAGNAIVTVEADAGTTVVATIRTAS